jgi:hypothetical protein
MNIPDPTLARPALVCLLAEGDDIFLPIHINGVGPVEYHRATVTGLEDDEPNRRIRMTVRFHSLDRKATNEVKPGDLVHRVIDGNGKVRIIRAARGPHPEDGRELLALVVEDGQQQRRPIFLEPTGGMFCEWSQ